MHPHYTHHDFVHRVICLSCIYTPGLEMSVSCCYHIITSYLLWPDSKYFSMHDLSQLRRSIVQVLPPDNVFTASVNFGLADVQWTLARTDICVCGMCYILLSNSY